MLVLEQHYVVGGTTHVFEDQGFEFDTGLHYIGVDTCNSLNMFLDKGEHEHIAKRV